MMDIPEQEISFEDWYKFKQGGKILFRIKWDERPIIKFDPNLAVKWSVWK